MSSKNEAYTVEIIRDTFMGIETETVANVPAGDVQAVKDGAKFTSGTGDTVTFKVTSNRS